MIVRISGEDQYRLDDGLHDQLDELAGPRTPRLTPTTRAPSRARSPSCLPSCAPTARAWRTMRSRPPT